MSYVPLEPPRSMRERLRAAVAIGKNGPVTVSSSGGDDDSLAGCFSGDAAASSLAAAAAAAGVATAGVTLVGEMAKTVLYHLVEDSPDDYPPSCRRRRASFFRLLACLTCLNPFFGVVALHTLYKMPRRDEVPRRGGRLWLLFFASISTYVVLLPLALRLSTAAAGTTGAAATPRPSPSTPMQSSESNWFATRECQLAAAADQASAAANRRCRTVVAVYWNRRWSHAGWPQAAAALAAHGNDVDDGTAGAHLRDTAAETLGAACAGGENEADARLALHSLGGVCSLLQLPPRGSSESVLQLAEAALWSDAGRACRLLHTDESSGRRLGSSALAATSTNSGSATAAPQFLHELDLWAEAMAYRCGSGGGGGMRSIAEVADRMKNVVCPTLKYIGDPACLTQQLAKTLPSELLANWSI